MKRFLKTAGVLVVMCFIGALLYGGTGCGHDDNLSLLEADTGAGANGEVDVGGDCPDCECNCDEDCCEGGDVICDCDATATATCEGECCCCDCCDDGEDPFCGDGNIDPGEDCEEDSDCTGTGEECIDCECLCEDPCDNDCDGVGNKCDNCPDVYNPDQLADCMDEYTGEQAEVTHNLCGWMEQQYSGTEYEELLVWMCHVGGLCGEEPENPEEPFIQMCVPDWCACCREPGPVPVPALAKVLDPVPVEEEECIGFGEGGLSEPNEPHEFHTYEEGFDLYGMCPVLQSQETIVLSGEAEPDPPEFELPVPLHEYCRECESQLSCIQACLNDEDNDPYMCIMGGISDDPDFCRLWTDDVFYCNVESGCCQEPVCGNGIIEPNESCGELGLPLCKEGTVCIDCECIPQTK
jgi:hypothetical protein